MATTRRMPTNIDVLDALTEKVSQEGNTTTIGGNLKVNGNITSNNGKQVLYNGNVKTLFGNQSIVGTGTINLYRHVIHATKQGAEFMIVVISSKNTVVNSVAKLKTLLGNTFEYPATGYYEGNATAIWKINESVATDIDYPSPTSFPLTEFTFTDTVTPV